MCPLFRSWTIGLDVGRKAQSTYLQSYSGKTSFASVHNLYSLLSCVTAQTIAPKLPDIWLTECISFWASRDVNSEMRTRMVLGSDDTITREGLRSLFGRAPEVEIIGEAATLMATPKKVMELLPDVALIEVSVPNREHGLRAAADIAGQSPQVRVVVLTNNGDLPYARSMLAAGVSGFLLKNSELSQLFAAVRRVKLGGKFIDPTVSNDLVWHGIEGKTKKTRSTFSRRESEVCRALVRGYTNAQSADVLKIGVKTVETYRLRIYRKLRLSTRAELVEYALAHRLLNENA